MAQKQESPAGDGGAFECLAGPRDTSEDNPSIASTPYQPGTDKCVVQAIRVELSERDPKRGDCTPVASCSLATVASASSPICSLARKLLALGVDPATHLSIWRGRTKCFHDVPVGRWAELTVDEGGTGTVFRRYKPFPGRAVAAQGAKSDG